MAYTKYSLTPANNTAAPPDGAPEGMLPSAVNDTMRDMMSQIRDVGDGVRDGTYTMTAPKITGGTITGVTLTGNTLTNPVITGATLTTSAFNGTVGATTASTGAFTTLSTSSTTTLSGLTASTALALDASKNVVSVTNTGTGNNVLSASPTLTGTIAGASLSLSSLTSGRVTYAGASGLLSDSANLTFSGTNLGITGTAGILTDASTIEPLYINAPTTTTGSGAGIRFNVISGAKESVGVIGIVNNATGNLGSMTFHVYNAGADIPEHMRLTNSGNLGLGGTPSAWRTTDRTFVIGSAGKGLSAPTSGNSIFLATNWYVSTSPANVYVGNGYATRYTQSDGSHTWATAPNNTSGADALLNFTDAMTLNASGNVGIGTSSPSAALSVIASPMVNQLLIGASTADSGYGSISFNGTSGATRIGFTGGGSGDPSLYYDAATAGIHQFRVNNAIKMVVDSSGNVLVGITTARANAGDVQVSKGISFPATQSAQSDANTLDDYEEGTFTAGIAFGGASVGVAYDLTPTCTYTKIGRQVTVTGRVGLSNKGSSTGDATITGLPFTPANTGNAGYGAIALAFGAGTTFSNVFQGVIVPNSTSIVFQQVTVAGTNSSLTDTNFSNSSNLLFSGTYFI